jgi:two-component sensor histidine kinase
MRMVVDAALTPHRAGEIRIRGVGPNVDLTAKQALSLALALHELATNATKYGAWSVPGGIVDISWTCDLSGPEPMLHFSWHESKGPKVSPPSHRGFGSRLIEGSLQSDFGGPVRVEYAPEGLICSFQTRLSALTAAAA